MKNIRVFLSENFPVLVVKFSIYLNRRVFVMSTEHKTKNICNRHAVLEWPTVQLLGRRDKQKRESKFKLSVGH